MFLLVFLKLHENESVKYLYGYFKVSQHFKISLKNSTNQKLIAIFSTTDQNVLKVAKIAIMCTDATQKFIHPSLKHRGKILKLHN